MIETLTLWSVILTGLLVVLTGVYAFLTYRIMAVNREAVAAMRAQIVASVRPYVYFEIVTTGPLVEGVLRNTGVSAAYDVTVSLQPTVQVHIRGSAQDSSLIGKPLSLIPPQKEIREFLGSFEELENGNASLKFTGTVAYVDSEGRRFRDPLTVDLSSLKGMLFIGRTTVEDELKKLNEKIADLAKA